MSVPPLAPKERLKDSERKRIGAILLDRYNAGKSIREICAETGYSIGRVRGLLEVAEVKYRPLRGGRRKKADTGP